MKVPEIIRGVVGFILFAAGMSAAETVSISTGTNVVLSWSTASGQVCSVLWTADLIDTNGFRILETFILEPNGRYAAPFNYGKAQGFYRVEWRPETNYTSAPQAVAGRITDRVILRNESGLPYTLALTYEAMLEMDRVTGLNTYSNYVFQRLATKGKMVPGSVIPYNSPPFCHLDYKLYQTSANTNYLANFIAQSVLYRDEILRSPEGAIVHYDAKQGSGLLIDRLQDYVSRMAQTGKLTGDTNYFAECALQFRLYRQILRRTDGLYSQGRGWLTDTNAISPGAWSRGQGWLIRGMVDSLDALPPGSAEFTEVQLYLQELADALLAAQSPDGMWHQLPYLPPGESYPDSTGTGLIMYNLARALSEGFLAGEKYRTVSERAYEALLHYVSPEGIVFQACPGPGPIWEIEPYLRTPGRTEDGTSHSPFCVIFACAGKVLLDQL